MAALGSQSIASSYEQLLHVDRNGGGDTTTHVSVKDGDNGTTFGFTIASDALMMSSTNRLEFGDTGTYIHQSADGVLDLVSDTEIEINATTIDMNGAVDISGNTQLGGTFTVGTDGSGQDVTFYSGTSGDSFVWDSSEEKLTITGTNGQTALDIADGNLVVADNIDLEGDMDVNGTSNLDNTDIDGTLADDGTTISLDATTSLNIDNSNTSNGITIGTATSGVPISIGHSTSETTVNDNLSVTGDMAVDGTANLDNTDIDGTLTQDGGNVVFNEDSGDYDFRIESNNNANMLLVDGGNDHVNIGTATDFGGVLNISTADNNIQLVLASTDADSNEGPIMDFHRNSASPATNDYTGVVRFRGENDNDEAINYAQIQTQMTGVGDGSEEGKFWISTMKGGTERQRMSIAGGETIFNEDSVDVDFRVESDNNANMLFVDAGNDRVGIGTGSPSLHFVVNAADGASDNEAVAYFGNQEATDGRSKGVQIRAGSTSDDWALDVADHDGSNSIMTILGNGVVSIPQGQLKFPATQNSSTDANTLDDYEEGTWLPQLFDNTSGGNQVNAYSVQVGSYTKIGNVVHIQGYVAANGLGSASGNVILRNLPFVSKSTSNLYGAISIGFASGLSIAAESSVTAYLDHNGSAYAYILNFDSATGTSNLQFSELTTDGGFIFSGTYVTN